MIERGEFKLLILTIFSVFILGSVYSVGLFWLGYSTGVASSAGYSVGVKEGQGDLFDSLVKVREVSTKKGGKAYGEK